MDHHIQELITNNVISLTLRVLKDDMRIMLDNLYQNNLISPDQEALG